MGEITLPYLLVIGMAFGYAVLGISVLLLGKAISRSLAKLRQELGLTDAIGRDLPYPKTQAKQ